MRGKSLRYFAHSQRGVVQTGRNAAGFARVARAVQAPGTLGAAGATRPFVQLAVEQQQVVVQSLIGKQVIAHGARSITVKGPLSMRRQ